MSKRVLEAAFLTTFLGMAAACAALSYRLYAGQNATAVSRPPATLLGRTIAPIAGLSGNGAAKRLDWRLPDARATVIYAFSPTCSWCARNLGNLKAMLAMPRSSFRFVGLSLSSQGLEEYLAANQLHFDEVIRSVNAVDLVQDGLTATPTTLVVSAQGKVLKYWRGAYLQKSQPDVEAFFGLKMPGLEEAPSRP